MLSTDDDMTWKGIDEAEQTAPSPRKVVSGRVTYTSVDIDVPDDGLPVICDLGEARQGPGPFLGEVLPDLYRAPEILLYIPWTEKIDIWSLGLMVYIPQSVKQKCSFCAVAGLGSIRRKAPL